MPYPIVEQIRQQLFAAAKTVTTIAKDGTSKSLTVEPVARFYNSTTDLVATVEQGAEIGVDDGESGSVQNHTHTQEFMVSVRIEQPNQVDLITPELRSFDVDARYNAIASDVRKVVDAWFYTGAGSSLVIWTKYLPTELYIDAVVVRFAIHYRTRLGNPYSQ